MNDGVFFSVSEIVAFLYRDKLKFYFQKYKLNDIENLFV
jgi:hypothetical protein